MSTLSQFTGRNRPPTALINATSSDGASISGQIVLFDSQAAGRKIVLSGVLTANTLVDVLNITSAGMIPLFYLAGTDSTSRTHRLKMTIDGVVVYDYTTAAVAATNRGLIAIGYNTTYNTTTAPDPVYFNSSLLIQYASSLTETDKTQFGYIYRTY